MKHYIASCKLHGETVEVSGPDYDQVLTRIRAKVPNGWWNNIYIWEVADDS